METGQKHLQTSNIDSNSHRDLSIQIHLNGLSFCILNKSSLTIEYLNAKTFDKVYTPEMTLEALVNHLKTEDVFSQPFDEIKVTHQSELATLVPDELFDKSKLNDYLKFNTKILESDYLTYDHNESLGIHTVYIPYVNINNQLLEEFGSFDYYHAYSTLTNAFLKLPKSKEAFLHLYIHVNKGHFEFIVFDAAKQLVFCNSFEYQTKEDFIYYILFVFEQLKLDKEKDVLHITGEIDQDDDYYNILFKYIRYITYVEIDEIYKFDETLQNINKHHHFLILNSFN